MASSPVVLSPRPNPPGTRLASNATKPRPLALLSNNSKSTRSPAPTGTSTPSDGGLDIAEQMNEEVRQQFVTGAKLGEGTYANVYAAHYRSDPTRLVAIKKMKVNSEYKDGIPPDAIREIKFLSELDHPNVIKLHAIFSTKDQNLSLVLEYLPRGDLEELWKARNITYGGADIKAWINMLIQGVWFCHENHVLHRDIKGGNCLLAADGTVKLADFGLARSFAEPGRKMTTLVITRMYRPPELLYGCRHYSGTADMWSVGVVLAELTIRNWFLPAETDMQELGVQCDMFGTPTEDTWPGVSSLPYYIPPEKQESGAAQATKGTIAAKMGHPMSWWRSRFPLLGDDGVDLLRGMLSMDPSKRLTARKALEHRWWTNLPRPTKKDNLPGGKSAADTKVDELKRKAAEAQANGRADKVARKLDFGGM